MGRKSALPSRKSTIVLVAAAVTQIWSFLIRKLLLAMHNMLRVSEFIKRPLADHEKVPGNEY
jgi:hypothetical protein